IVKLLEPNIFLPTFKHCVDSTEWPNAPLGASDTAGRTVFTKSKSEILLAQLKVFYFRKLAPHQLALICNCVVHCASQSQQEECLGKTIWFHARPCATFIQMAVLRARLRLRLLSWLCHDTGVLNCKA